MSSNFKALRTFETSNGTFESEICKRNIDDLPNGDILIRVEYSSLNYKDALSANGNRGVTKNYPHTPGIDAAGLVEESNDKNFPVGTSVIVTGFDLGMNTSGGFSEYIRVPSEWVVKCPDNLSTRKAMILGTAGLTAGLCTLSILNKISPIKSNIIVSGATGGVGSIGVHLLSSLNANVTAITSKINEKELLKKLGAASIIEKNKFLNLRKAPLSKGMYDAAIDVVGGDILSSIISSMKYKGTITICGNVSSHKFQTTVFPFILRANSLIGIDSASCSIKERKVVWNKFANEWSLDKLDLISKTVNLGDLHNEIQKIMNGKQIGRVLVKL